MVPIHLSKVSFTYGHGTGGAVSALDQVDLLVAREDFITIVGSNGSGKTTLLKIIAGTLKPTTGNIWVDGRLATNLPERVRALPLAFLQQISIDNCVPSMTVEENLTLALLKGKPPSLLHFVNSKVRRQEVERLIDTFGIQLQGKLSSPVRELSGGQKQAMALAMALSQNPEILLLDEPTAAFDPTNQKALNSLICRLVASQRLIALMVSHRPEDAIAMGNRLIMLDRGRIVHHFSGNQKAGLTTRDLLELQEAHSIPKNSLSMG